MDSSPQQIITIGREADNDLVLDYPMISAHHARVLIGADQVFLEDLDSTNGTFVNGRRITGIESLRSGDVVSLGTYTLTVTGDGTLERRDYRGNITIEARGVSVDVPGARLLADVSLTIYPSEFVGLMGPSGVGKTTLIGALNGYAAPSAGQVLCNGQDLYANYDRFRGHIGCPAGRHHPRRSDRGPGALLYGPSAAAERL